MCLSGCWALGLALAAMWRPGLSRVADWHRDALSQRGRIRPDSTCRDSSAIGAAMGEALGAAGCWTEETASRNGVKGSHCVEFAGLEFERSDFKAFESDVACEGGKYGDERRFPCAEIYGPMPDLCFERLGKSRFPSGRTTQKIRATALAHVVLEDEAELQIRSVKVAW